MYSEKYLQHFSSPQNVGEITDPDGVCEVAHTGGGCFDRIKMTLKVEGDRIVDIKYKLRACSGTIAASSAVTSLALGKTLTEAGQIGAAEILTELDGVPEKKMHSVELAVEALREVVADYRKRVSL